MMVLLARFDLIEYDFDHDLLASVCVALDTHLAKLDGFEDDEEADAWDIFHDRDNTIGLGFAAAQTYITSVSRELGIKRHAALIEGPPYTNNLTIAQIVNAAANYWKHRDEWEDECQHDGRDRTVRVLVQVGVDPAADYPLSQLMAKLGLARTSDVAKSLLPWRDELWKRRHVNAPSGQTSET